MDGYAKSQRIAEADKKPVMKVGTNTQRGYTLLVLCKCADKSYDLA
jgi:hypothetical protein